MSTPGPIPQGSPNDAPIGRAFWRSIGILAAIMVCVLGGFFWDSWRTQKREIQEAALEPPKALNAPLDVVPEVSFVEVTTNAGIRFEHFSGAAGEKLLPETMGAGVAIFDFDGDGKQDVLFVNGADWPWTAQKLTPAPSLALYRNLGQWRFVDVTSEMGLRDNFYGTGVAVGDYDNDGKVDVFLSGMGGFRLYHSEGSSGFRDVSKACGIAEGPKDWGTSAAWIDYDNDGDLDLFVCHYVQWSRDIDIAVDYRLVGVGRAYGPPDNFPGSFPKLFRNDGNGHFVDVSEISGIQVSNRATGKAMGKSLGVAPVDLDQDGWMDLIVANDTVQNFVFHNEKGGRFKEIGALSGIAFDSYGAARGAMGIDTARVQEDDELSVAIGNFANEMTALYVSQHNPLLFSDEAIAQGIGPVSRLALSFGVFFFDYDLDGWQDFLAVNGHIEQEINRVQKSQHYRQPSRLYWNSRGKGLPTGFVAVPESKVGTDLGIPRVGRGSAFGDLDGDGDLDVVMTQVGGAPAVLRNDQKLGHGYVRFRLVGKHANRDAIGAWIMVRLGGRSLWRQVMPTRGYLSQSELPVTFGLGNDTSPTEVAVKWPGGKIQKVPLSSVRINQENRIEEP